MAGDEELERLMSDLESDRVERKESLADRDRLRQAICAFANDMPGHGLPGYLFVGASDAGHPTALPVSDQLLLTLAEMKTDGNILPIPSMTVGKRFLKGSEVAVVEVQPSEMPPVRFKGQTWIRLGPRRAIATIEEERRLTERRVSAALTFDQMPCAEARLEDLLVDKFRSDYLPRVVSPDVIAENKRTIEEQLASLRFFDLRRRVPTHAGVLLVGRDPLQFIGSAYIQFVRFDGITRADPVQDHKEMNGDLIAQLLQLDLLLRAQIHTARVPTEGLRHVDRPDYPFFAVRELALNAVMHRDYQIGNAPARLYWFNDRVEIQNSGGLYGQVTSENFQRVSAYRNRVLAEAMKALGYVERFGVGIVRANAALQANGNPPAEFVFEPSHVLVTIRRRPNLEP